MTALAIGRRPTTPDRRGYGPRVAVIGDSISIGGSETLGINGATRNRRVDRDILWWMSMLSGGHLIAHRNAGISSNNLTSQAARFQTDVAAYAPDVVIIGPGLSGATAGTHLPTVAEKITEMVEATRAIGAMPVLCTPTPTDTAGLARQNVWIVGSWLRSYAASEDIMLVDLTSLLIDPVTGGIGAFSADGLHPTSAGARLIGQALADAIGPRVADWSPPLALHQTPDAVNLTANGLFLADSAGLGDGWTKSGNITASIVSGDPTIRGNWQRIVKTDAAEGTLVQTLAGWSVGDRLAVCGRVKYAMGAGAAPFDVRLTLTSSSQGSDRAFSLWTGPLDNLPFYHEVVIPPGTTTVGWFIALGAGAAGDTFAQLAQLTVTNLTVAATP